MALLPCFLSCKSCFIVTCWRNFCNVMACLRTGVNKLFSKEKSVLISLISDTSPTRGPYIKLIFGAGRWNRGLLRPLHASARYCSTSGNGAPPNPVEKQAKNSSRQCQRASPPCAFQLPPATLHPHPVAQAKAGSAPTASWPSVDKSEKIRRDRALSAWCGRKPKKVEEGGYLNILQTLEHKHFQRGPQWSAFLD